MTVGIPIFEVNLNGDPENDVGLLDSGASEVVRPYIGGWAHAIRTGQAVGREVPVCLAGGVRKTGVMTIGGEVMIPRVNREAQGWILPMTRIVEELGGAVSWDVLDFKIIFPCARL